jgi:hypothetical protein
VTALLVILIPLAVVGVAAAWWVLREIGGPCDGCDQPVIDCRCPVAPVEAALLAADTQADAVAVAGLGIDVARGWAETADEFAARTHLQPTIPQPRKES